MKLNVITASAFAFALSLSLSSLHYALGATYPFATTEMVFKINNLQNSWKASLNTPTAQMSPESIHSLLGVRKGTNKNFLHSTLLPTRHFSASQLSEVPESYDPRDHYSNCKSMHQIRDQSMCGSCWAFGAVSAMSDRECIVHGKDIILSAEDVNSCSGGGDCGGGFPFSAYLYWMNTGIVTEKCRPYSLPSCDHYRENATNPCPSTEYPTPKCVQECVNASGLNWTSDKHKASDVYFVSGESDMMAELSLYGPCEGTMDVYDDFLLYESGVYYHVAGSDQGSHAIKVMGYGVDENGTKYWLCANSWNDNWGENGYFRIRRGTDECSIEGTLYCGYPEK